MKAQNLRLAENMNAAQREDDGWESRRSYLMAVLCQTIGVSTFIVLPNLAVARGATGYLIGYLLTYILFGVPLLYLEFIIGQFTTRDCIQVWKICPCLSHIGYFHVFWQFLMLLYNHSITSFTIHYLMISFEDPKPYYQCGPWAKVGCNALIHNYTVNQDCIQQKDPALIQSYCQSIYLTFPECQYWKNHLLGLDKKQFHIIWRICFASALNCTLMFLSCFKRRKSLQWFIYPLAVYPMFGYFLLMTGSMLQKGIVVVYQEALDSDFSLFRENGRLSEIVIRALLSLNLGTGVSYNLASSTSFRSPCFSNVTITVIVGAVFTTLSVCTYAMMSCSYAYEYNISPATIMKYKMTFMTERTPRLLFEYQNKTFWLALTFSSNAVLGLATNSILLLNLLKIFAKRCVFAARYPGLSCLVAVACIFFTSIPLLGSPGVHLTVRFSRYIGLISMSITVLECLVFVLWYGHDRLSEDVHFMLGFQPKIYMKFAWPAACVVLVYAISNEVALLVLAEKTLHHQLGCYGMLIIILFLLLTPCVKLLMGIYRKRLRVLVRLDPTWGPRDEVLQRSRAMFTAEALTKEYLYRQYHLQAGILERQRRANVRAPRDV